MRRLSGKGFERLPGIILLLFGIGLVSAPGASAQWFETAVPSRARILPEITSGVNAMKRDAAGRLYVLANPANEIWIFSADGKRIGEIPPAGSAGKIQYAVDFDLDSDGRILVADRAANAIKIFSPEGALVARVSVFAPTGVVALPDRQFAVSTLRSKRLVEIRDEQGVLVRSFGDPADAGIEPDPNKLQNLGKVTGDGLGDIYFAFVTLPDPTIRKFDRYGYAAADAHFDASRYSPSLDTHPDDRVQVGFNYSESNFSSAYNTWATIGNKGDVLFGGGVSPGLGSRLGGNPATAQSATDSLLATGLATGPGGGGPGGRAGGGTLSAQGSYQGDDLQFHFGRKLSGSGSKGNSSDGSHSGQGSGDGTDFHFNAQDSSNDLSDPADSEDNTQALLYSAQQAGLSGASGGFNPGGHGFGGGFGGPGAGTLGGAGFFPGLGGFGRVGGGDFAGGIGGGFVARDLPSDAPNLSETSASKVTTISTPGNTTAAPASGTGTTNRFGDHRYGGHGYGRDAYNFTGTVKVNLDHFTGDSEDKPMITAVGIDPATQEIWAAVGRVLAHFDKNGRYLGEYYIVTPEGTPLRASAIVVEPDKLIVASDSRGVYEFARLDRRAAPKAAVQASATSSQAQQPDAAKPSQPH
jgi:hypothetical protein